MKKLEERFGLILRDLRLKRGYSQEGLATDCELDRTYISLMERGLRQPTITTLFKLASALNVTASSLVKELEK